jgi:hypothetical protein
MPLDQIVLPILAPSIAWTSSLVLAFDIDSMLKAMTTSRGFSSVPRIVINRNANPRILLRASAVTNGNTFRANGLTRARIATTLGIVSATLLLDALTNNIGICRQYIVTSVQCTCETSRTLEGLQVTFGEFARVCVP